MSDIEPPKQPAAGEVASGRPRLSREALDAAIAAGRTPVIDENGKLRPLFSPSIHHGRMLDDYRYLLRGDIAGMSWSDAGRLAREDLEHREQHKANLLFWGYQALQAERDAAPQYEEMAQECATAASVVNTLAFVVRQDQRCVDGVPLHIVCAENAALYKQHVEALGSVFRRRTKRAAALLQRWIGTWFEWLTRKGILVAEADGKRSRYHAHQMSLQDMEQMARLLAFAGELSSLLVCHGITAVLRAQRRGGNGRWPVLLDAWLVQQGRSDEPVIGPAKLARMMIARGLASPTDDVVRVTDRLKKAARRHKEPIVLFLP